MSFSIFYNAKELYVVGHQKDKKIERIDEPNFFLTD